MSAPAKRLPTRARPADAAVTPKKSARDDFAAFVCEQLAELPALKSRPMFGGHGLYSGEAFFGIIWRGSLYFKTCPATLPDYLAADMGWFQPAQNMALKKYYEVPPHVLERRSELVTWARRAAAL